MLEAISHRIPLYAPSNEPDELPSERIGVANISQEGWNILGNYIL